jgi:hypothetical protein
MVRGEIEPFRDRDGHQLRITLEGRRQTVRLASQAAGEHAANLSLLDLGFVHEWSRWTARYPGKLRLEPVLRLGLGLSGSEPSYRRLRFEAGYHQLLPAAVEADFRFHGGAASGSTPVFELPSFGGEESVRGFRADDALGRRLWALQSEFWIPLPRVGDPSSRTWEFLRRNVWLAPFYDSGGVFDRLAPTGGFRQGVGAGVRLSVQGALLALDWAYGSGRGASGDGRGRLYFTVRLP